MAARYALAVVAIAAAVGLRLACDPWLGPVAYPFVILFPAIILVGWAAGREPALLSVALGTAATAYWVIPPRGIFGAIESVHLTGVVLFVVAALVCASVAHSQRQARKAVRSGERARRHLERQTSALLGGLPNSAVFVVDAELRIESAGGQLQSGGRPAAALAGKPVAALAGLGADPAWFRDALGGAAFEHEGTPADRVVSWRGAPLRDDDGSVDGVIAIASDVTEGRRARDAQRESEKRLRSLANAMPQLVWMADAAGKVHYYNTRVDQYAGLQHADDGSWSWSAVVHPDDIEATRRTWEIAQRSGAPYSMEHRLRMLDGSYRWHLSRATRGRDAGGDALTWYGTATDIDELKHIEEALRENARRANLAIRIGRIGLWRYDPSSDEVEFDERMRKIWGDAPAKGSMASALLRVHADDVDRVMAAMASALDSGGKGRFEVECRVIRPDGGEQWVVANAQVEFADGRAARMTGSARDITERRSFEEQLRRSEERYRAFVGNSSEGIWCIEFEPPVETTLPVEQQIDLVYARGRTVECNEAMARMYGVASADELLGETLAMMLPPDVPASRAYLASIIESGYSVQDAESEERDAHGRTRWFSNGISAVIENGLLKRVWGTQRDITDNKRAEAARAEVAALRP